MTTAAKWWHVDGNRLICDLCPRECGLHEGQRGFCFVRQNVGGVMELTTYGRSSGFCVDPIEKKPLNHFLPGTPVLSFGTEGCNLGCKFCQNWSISKAKVVEKLGQSASPAAIAWAAKNAGCKSVAFTYNDPVIWAEYAIDTAKACHDLGIKTVAVTAGYISPCAREEFYREMDAANVDLKAFSETFYKYTTFSKMQPILDTLVWLKRETNVWFEITNLLIPGENDSTDETTQMCDWIVENLGPAVPVHFTAFHPDFKMLDKPRTPHETLIRAREIARQAGIHFAYVGNVNDVQRQSTYCPHCQALLIERDWYELGAYNLAGDRCRSCQATIPGVFEARPGTWGRKRQPLTIPPAPGEMGQESRMVSVILPSIPNAATQTPRSTGSRKDDPQMLVNPKVDFSEENCGKISEFARTVVASAVARKPMPALDPELAGQPTYGVFITLKRGDTLRACRGRWGEMGTLAELVSTAARDTALNDPRFPAIAPTELPWLHVEVSLMHSPHALEGAGSERAEQVVVGQHGLVIQHPQGRGLLLPQVATAHGFTNVQFLEAVCRKAGLPTNLWQAKEAQLMTFEANVLESDPPTVELDARLLSQEELQTLHSVASAVFAGSEIDRATLPDVLTRKRTEELGVVLMTTKGRRSLRVGVNDSLVEHAASAARGLGVAGNEETIANVVALFQAIPIEPADYPNRTRGLAGLAIVARRPYRWSVAAGQAGEDTIAKLLVSVDTDRLLWSLPTNDTTVTAYAFVETRTAPIPPPAATKTRPAAKAGQFYPREVKTMDADLDRFLAEGADAEPVAPRAILLPHAGWSYCGSIIGKVLGEVTVPDRVIVLSPKHTPFGPNWSMSAAETWEIPGAQIPIDVAMREALLREAPDLAVEDDAHRAEHGVEVLLPFLHRKNPNLRVLPIVMGATDYEATSKLAESLAKVVGESEEPCLLVISSDLNHFADEVENRRLDELAIDATATGNPLHLYNVVRENKISMCGVLPAVTVMQTLTNLGRPTLPRLVDYTNSGIVTGKNDRVVGYAGFVLE